jgi:hypothetical protein
MGRNRRSRHGLVRGGNWGGNPSMDRVLDREEELDKIRFEKRELMLDEEMFYVIFPEYRDVRTHDFDRGGNFFSQEGYSRLKRHCHDTDGFRP